MRRYFYPVLAALLVVVVAATSVTVAVARAQPRVADEVVICSGYAVMTVYLDAQGNPVSQPLPCPEATLAVLLPPLVPPMPERPETRSELLAAGPGLSQHARLVPAALARGPPVLV
jgi:hypothetical protein